MSFSLTPYIQQFLGLANKLKLICTICILTLSFQLILCESFAQYIKLHDFDIVPDGRNPHGSLLSDGTFLYGMTYQGGINNLGTIIKIKPDGTGYYKVLEFAGLTTGSHPWGSLFFDGTFFYGMTQDGGTNNLGVIFKVKPDGTGFAKLFDFTDATNGFSPSGSLISDGVFLYGVVTNGGANNVGTIFKIKPDGTGFVKIFDFTAGVNGANPIGDLISDGIFLYGMTYLGGTSNLGIIYKILPNGTGFTKLLDFIGPNGFYPNGSLLYDGTFMYGMTNGGGTDGFGTIFKIKPDGTAYAKLFDFLGTSTGRYPKGSLIFDGAFLYGMTYTGGLNDRGTIFQIKADGTGFTNLLDFSFAANGALPWGSLISDGTFLYGMTEDGGTNAVGTIFKFATTPIALPTITSFTPLTGPIGTTVTITGKNFSTLLTDNTVRFNGTLATVLASSATSITTTVPAGASSGAITVTVSGNTATSVSNFTVTVSPIIITANENQVTLASIKVFPNPAGEQLFIEVQEQSTMTIYDLMGQSIRSKTLLIAQPNEIEIQDLTSPTYILTIKSASKTEYFKIIKSH